jgi:hypothetical protein
MPAGTWPTIHNTVTSLTAPGNRSTYVDPYNANNTTVAVGSWVHGCPGVSNSKNVRDALHNLESLVITVPVWDTSVAQGNNCLYHVAGFAQVQITGYYLPSQNRISATFLGFTSCGGGGGD